MSLFQSFHLRAFVAVMLAYAAFLALMTDRFALMPLSAGTMAAQLLGLAVMLAVVLAVLWALHLGRRTAMDERETRFDVAAERAGYRAIDVGIFALIALILADAQWDLLGTFDLSRPEAQVLALVTLTTIGGLARFATALWQERRR